VRKPKISDRDRVTKRISDRDAYKIGCRGKRKFKTEDGAHRAAKSIVRNGGDRMHPYRCWACRRWHIGH